MTLPVSFASSVLEKVLPENRHTQCKPGFKSLEGYGDCSRFILSVGDIRAALKWIMGLFAWFIKAHVCKHVIFRIT